MKKQYTKKQITEAIAYWKKQLRSGNYSRVNENTDIDWTEYMSKTAGDFIIGLEDDSPNLKAVFVVNAIIPKTTRVSEWTWYDSNDNEHILPPTTINLNRVFDKYEIDVECVVSDVRVAGGKVLIILDEPHISGGKYSTKNGLSVGEVLAAVRMAKPNAEITAAFANDLSKTVKVFIEFRNDACYELYPEGWGKNQKNFKTLDMPKGLVDDLLDLHGDEIMEDYVDEYIRDEKERADYDRMSDYIYRNGRYIQDPDLI